MDTDQGNLALLQHPTAQQLLQSAIPARLAYVARDGSPRAIPIIFDWTGQEVVLGTWPEAEKVAALQAHPAVALTIDTNTMPFAALMLRGMAQVEEVAGVPPEYERAAIRYLGEEAGRAWVAQIAQLFPRMVRIRIQPTWVGLLDFQTRFPSGIARAPRHGS